jgi:uncharacterized HAD superfamily protein
MASKKILKIGFDLDGVIIDKPPIIPKFIIEGLVRGKRNKGISYRYPKYKIERWVRWLSHHPLLRPPIKENLIRIEELYKADRFKLYIVSSRYSFLEQRTEEWFNYYKLKKLFKEIHINKSDLQPHEFKEKMIKKLKLNVFIDDDLPLLEYLKKKLKNVELVFAEDQDKYLKDMSK